MESFPHRRATGHPVGEHCWAAALLPVLLWVHSEAYPYATAHAEARDNARAHALADGFSAEDAEEYGRRYARLSTGANADAFAQANARATTAALARAFAAGCPRACARTFPGAPRAGAGGNGDRRAARTVLAEGFADALAAERDRPA
ncbi:hypothetical protein V1L54_27620 [Streptomyces sp. TRM 70361]|uniref:hypothetical protein n=1 Tax=Streptomyces sp. TRM 70361 TaxID=3116553 RepID=UPI002E7AAF4A|nr:hypothetical protein [Streptomyces sp. TRM 70361]MEE1943127.1 hypothetical protein [Streptomyces sp. TRM 70361]